VTAAKIAEPKLATNPTGVSLTEPAAAKIRRLMADEPRTDLRLRIEAMPGGCSGMRYQLYFDPANRDGDQVSDYEGFSVVVGEDHLPNLAGATIDFPEQAQGFTIDNPQAKPSCSGGSCGDSCC
jgi:iron-sulfur cluster assembly accessory protein